MIEKFAYRLTKATVALKLKDYYVWDCSVIEKDGKYHMFSSRWKQEYGFGWNWLFNSEIIHCVADAPQGPFRFVNVALPRRGRNYFDGMNTHNTCVKEYNGKFYLYYMGTTYGGKIPRSSEEISPDYAAETWNRKRIGVAVSDDLDREFVRKDEPVLNPRDCSHWDCTVTTNPSVIILPDGKTYMIYKSRRCAGAPLQLGIAVADKPDGKFERLTEGPILDFKDSCKHMEDPFIWYDEDKGKFCLIAKDDSSEDGRGITGEWGAGFYAESDDCIRFEVAKTPKVYSRKLHWLDKGETVQCNLERPSLLLNQKGEPVCLYCASGNGSKPYLFEGLTYIVAILLEKDK